MNDNRQGRLSSPEYWDGLYKNAPADTGKPGLRQRVRTCVPAWLLAMRRAWLRRAERRRLPRHADYLLTEVLLRPHLEGRSGWKGLEIGSAPGHRILGLWERFGIEPHGLEYTPNGVALQRANYRARGLPEEWVVHGDFFDETLRTRWAERFDLVASYGFVEHFEDPAAVIAGHLDLVRPGGLLVITVPNLSEGTVYGRLQRRFNPEVYALHNIRTCTLEPFRALFTNAGCDLLFCGPLGGFDIWFPPDRRPFSRWVSGVLGRIHPLTNWLNHRLIGKRLTPFPRTSTLLAAVAVKHQDHERMNSMDAGADQSMRTPCAG